MKKTGRAPKLRVLIPWEIIEKSILKVEKNTGRKRGIRPGIAEDLHKFFAALAEKGFGIMLEENFVIRNSDLARMGRSVRQYLLTEKNLIFEQKAHELGVPKECFLGICIIRAWQVAESRDCEGCVGIL